MKNTSIRLRPDQREFIAEVLKVKTTDFSEFVRLCVDTAAIAVAENLPTKVTLTPLPVAQPLDAKITLTPRRRGRLVSIKTLKAARADGKANGKARAAK